MWTVFPAGKSAAIMHDEVTSVAPSSTIKVMPRPIRPRPGITRSKDEPPVRPGGHLVIGEDARHILPVRVAAETWSVIGTFAAGVAPTRKVPSDPGPGLQADDPRPCPTRRGDLIWAYPDGCVMTS